MAARVLAIAKLVVGRLATARATAPVETVQSDGAGAVVQRVVAGAADVGKRTKAIGGKSGVDSRGPNWILGDRC